MAKAMVEVVVDDLDGSEAVETVRLGWNGEWRELDLSKRNVAALSRAVDGTGLLVAQSRPAVKGSVAATRVRPLQKAGGTPRRSGPGRSARGSTCPPEGGSRRR